MNTRAHIHAEAFPTSPERLFDLLCRPSAIRQWWGAARAIVEPKTHGIWSAAWGPDEDQPDFITSARIQIYDPPRRLVLNQYHYSPKTGPLPFHADFVTEFLIKPDANGVALQVIQSGFPTDGVADEFYQACHRGWQDTFAGIRRYLANL